MNHPDLTQYPPQPATGAATNSQPEHRPVDATSETRPRPRPSTPAGPWWIASWQTIYLHLGSIAAISSCAAIFRGETPVETLQAAINGIAIPWLTQTAEPALTWLATNSIVGPAGAIAITVALVAHIGAMATPNPGVRTPSTLIPATMWLGLFLSEAAHPWLYPILALVGVLGAAAVEAVADDRRPWAIGLTNRVDFQFIDIIITGVFSPLFILLSVLSGTDRK